MFLRELGPKQVLKEFLNSRAQSAVYIVGFLIVLVLEFGSVTVLAAEQGAPGSNIETASDAIWWSIVTMSTVGYGDYSPVTLQGRIVGLFVIVVGVALFGVVTGFLANRFVGSGDEEQESTEVEWRAGDMATILEQIKSLQAEHERSYSELASKLEGLKSLIQAGGQQD